MFLQKTKQKSQSIEIASTDSAVILRPRNLMAILPRSFAHTSSPLRTKHSKSDFAALFSRVCATCAQPLNSRNFLSDPQRSAGWVMTRYVQQLLFRTSALLLSRFMIVMSQGILPNRQSHHQHPFRPCRRVRRRNQRCSLSRHPLLRSDLSLLFLGLPFQPNKYPKSRCRQSLLHQGQRP